MNRPFRQSAAEVEERIGKACERSGRSRSDVHVVAVTKYVPVERAREAIEAGYRHIGENRWQDARIKWEAFQDMKDVVWHFIGHLQTNKVKDVVGRFHMIHSLDRLSLAEEINRKAAALQIVVPCFVQVNVSGEESKYGLAPEQCFEFVERLRGFAAIDVAGLMTMAPHVENPELTRPIFRQTRELRDEINLRGVYRKPLRDLSMGMSNDFEIAIEEGATWIRLGSVLVGKDRT